jgi:hypothetical protein
MALPSLSRSPSIKLKALQNFPFRIYSSKYSAIHDYGDQTVDAPARAKFPQVLTYRFPIKGQRTTYLKLVVPLWTNPMDRLPPSSLLQIIDGYHASNLTRK